MKNNELIKLFHKLGNLKTIKRTGWVRVGVPKPESVADHSFRTAFIAMIIGDFLKLDTLKLLKMSLLHDLPEIITGDITPHDGMDAEVKRDMETNAVHELLKSIPGGDKYIDLWLEYEYQETPEAQLLKNIDRFEMGLQAIEYQKLFSDLDLREFMSDVELNKIINSFSK